MQNKRFRVWHKELGRFLSKEEYLLDFDGKLVFVNFNRADTTDMVVRLAAVNPDFYVLQQWTGFLDTDGKEIYEGDILRFKYSEEDAAEGLDAEIDCVVFQNGCFKLNKSTHEILEDLMEYKSFMLEDEIIGNIFETPNLLKLNEQ